MKKTILYICLLGATLGMTSACKKDVLNQNAPDKLDSETYWTSKERALSGLAAAYSQIEGFVYWDNYVEARSVRNFYREDYVQPGDDAYNYSWWMEHYNFNFTAGNYAIDLLWRENYRGIYYSNQVLEKVTAMPPAAIDDAARKQILAEAHFLRAYYHMNLLLNFDRIIIREKVPASETDIPKQLSARKESWDFICNDLKQAEQTLPLRSARPATELGRATKGAAQAFLGKIYLYRAGEEKASAHTHYTDAATWLGKVYASGEYKLTENFMNMFNGLGRNTTESIFELQQTADVNNGASYSSYLNDWMAASEMGGYGEIYGTGRLLKEMQQEGRVATDGNYDHRIYATILFNDPYFNDPATRRAYGYTYHDIFGENATTVAFRKWIPDSLNRLGRDNAINVPLVRLADVMLMLAESYNELGKPGEAMDLVNRVRARAAMPPLQSNDKQIVFRYIMHERVMELTLEGCRFYDLRRWGLLPAKMQEAGRTFSPDKAFYPLPLKETVNNPMAH
ncbi:RagB/SusD family nutrient uptake outer membrane protein [Chitinophaga pendula]|uniref:RagB/SusD family nutrient uptake outer membrane protein n=1 Tax=Chitinophaga TaxID=79328 RepID=UPI0018E027CF|nr:MULTISPECIES: RagB/SusD family nutrient uptake outer membrane protein [Chitinophaga]UCJ08798.1 RagB/SusD family nutrient uptake outer membrane protein [Chitinophaga pendula]